MSPADCLNRLTPLFRQVFADEQLVVREDLMPAQVRGWDSVNFVRLLAAVEREFGIELSARDLAAVTGAERKVAALMRVLEQQSGGGTSAAS